MTSDPMFAVRVNRRRRSAAGAVLAVLAMILAIGDASAGYADGVPAQRPDTAIASGADAGTRQAPDEIGGVTAIAAGWGHNLGLRPDGTVIAWGWSDSGQLGNGDHGWYQSETPVQVCAVGQTAPCTQFLTGVIAIAAGEFYSLALLRDRTVVAWGNNTTGQLGDGTTIDRLTPVRVCAVGQVAPCSQFLNAVRAVAAGFGHSMALLGNGSVVTWGGNSGALGDGTTIRRLTPVRVCAAGQIAPCAQYLYGVRHIDAGSGYSLAQLSSGGVLAWGYNRWGQLGDGTSDLFRLTPTRVCGVRRFEPCTQYLSLIRTIAAGTDHNLALQVDYTVISWGGEYYPEFRS
ncbi:hypothetical protein [Solwaraspora sp. WMMD792]|uniref:RCC1 domain-containing protein n=1 Tax=Solwaraspora sp. WMMD792 TaxID=3016099 RepID=UPI0024177A73|nr:hypothetical protein [Solwaraspora sp. WMMD792]MDG4769588.1 hypothetical protein [Solwaraspora sp. WMMD792]